MRSFSLASIIHIVLTASAAIAGPVHVESKVPGARSSLIPRSNISPRSSYSSLLFIKREASDLCYEEPIFTPVCCKGPYPPLFQESLPGSCRQISTAEECPNNPDDNGSGAKIYCCLDFDPDTGVGTDCHTPVSVQINAASTPNNQGKNQGIPHSPGGVGVGTPKPAIVPGTAATPGSASAPDKAGGWGILDNLPSVDLGEMGEGFVKGVMELWGVTGLGN